MLQQRYSSSRRLKLQTKVEMSTHIDAGVYVLYHDRPVLEETKAMIWVNSRHLSIKYVFILQAIRLGQWWMTVDVDILRSASRAALVLDTRIVSRVAVQDPSRQKIGEILDVIRYIPRAYARIL